MAQGPHRRGARATRTLAGVVAMALAATACSIGGGSGGTSTATITTSDGNVPIGELSKDLQSIARTTDAAGCKVSEPDQINPAHVSKVSATDYSSDPPSSGPHFQQWAKWGFFDKPVHDGYAVHNLEHGGVVVWYGSDVPKSFLTSLRDDELHELEKWVVTPRPDFTGMASAAWGALLKCDAKAVKAMDATSFGKLLREWYDDVNSRGTESEGDLSAIPPAGDLDDLRPKLPNPERNISDKPLF